MPTAARRAIWRWRAEPQSLLGFSKTLGRTVLLDIEAAEQLASRRISSGPTFLEMPLSEEDRQAVLACLAQAREQKAPPRSFSAPETLHVALTRACPFSCPCCYLERGAGESIAWDRLAALLTEAACEGVLQVAFGGGEPLLYPRLDDAVELAAARGLGVSLTTTGFGVDAPRLDHLRTLGLDHLQVSMPIEANGVDSRIERAASSALRVARSVGMRSGVNLIVTHEAVGRLPSLVAGLARQGVQRVNLLRPKPAALESGWFQANRLRGADWQTLAAHLWRIKRDRPEIKVTLDSALSPVLAGTRGRLGARPAAGCAAGRRFIAVDALGRLKPCSHYGPAEDAALRHYWWSSPALQRLRSLDDTIGPQCAACEHLSHCRGCRAVAEGTGPDPDSSRAPRRAS